MLKGELRLPFCLYKLSPQGHFRCGYAGEGQRSPGRMWMADGSGGASAD